VTHAQESVKHDDASTAAAASANEKRSNESVRRMTAHWRVQLEFARAVRRTLTLPDPHLRDTRHSEGQVDELEGRRHLDRRRGKTSGHPAA